MSDRQSMGAKLRFEVFKRDNFTCQYCGQKAPDVILHVDHINPVSKGGQNDILNLITACAGCNGGKGATLLTDRSEIEKQRAQLEELNERRQQLEWMLEWRNHLEGFEDDKIEAIAADWTSRAVGWTINDTGKRDLRKWEKNFGTELLLEAIKAAAEQYLRFNEDGTATDDTVQHAFGMIPRVAGGMKTFAEKPYMRDVYYVRAVLRNRLNYVDERKVVRLCREAILLGLDPDWLRQFSKDVPNWTFFRREIEEYIENNRPGDEE